MDSVGAGSLWIPEDRYRSITGSVPIACVDILLISADDPSLFGLIHRETYDGGSGWCLVGGAVLRNEPLIQALRRHITTTLGDKILVDPGTITLRTTVEYFTERGLGAHYDPRKHAIALTYTGRCTGVAQPAGEALAFNWFRASQLADIEFGFDQEDVVNQLLVQEGVNSHIED